MKLQGYNGEWGGVVFFAADGSKAGKGVVWAEDAATGKIYFYEILGQSGIGGIPYLKVEDKDVYRRLLIRRVFPCLPKDRYSDTGFLDEKTEYQMEVTK
ncbi:hypothetical protein E4O05_01270 [Treponema sp. OMZ 787]|uniref:hypothetical protein n=1 Tax=Treponema sp. OMZ 787 TaxID=2563669 RepID=UPI0020A4B1FB|nr:hypothetical protein [Treponema sp. OMZ 787]UTC62574.1 hypothetical protein E4O05_01270 [Treponema sp. OMZ 787]